VGRRRKRASESAHFIATVDPNHGHGMGLDIRGCSFGEARNVMSLAAEERYSVTLAPQTFSRVEKFATLFVDSDTYERAGVARFSTSSEFVCLLWDVRD